MLGNSFQTSTFFVIYFFNQGDVDMKGEIEESKVTSEKIGKGCGIGCFVIILIIAIFSIIGSLFPENEQRKEKSDATKAYI